jgi:hypothetical protein
MNPLLLTPLLEMGKSLVAKLWPDPAQQAEAQARLLELQQRGELAELDAQLRLALAQADINRADATGASLMQRTWRPFIGWVGGLSLAYQFLLQPLLVWLSLNAGWQAPPPLASDMLFSLVTQLLGLGALRTYEKVRNAE